MKSEQISTRGLVHFAECYVQQAEHFVDRENKYLLYFKQKVKIRRTGK